MAAVHYQTFQHLRSMVNYILYPLGLCILMVGVRILVRENKTDETDNEDGGETDERRTLEPASIDGEICEVGS